MLDFAYPPETVLPYLAIFVEFLRVLAWPIAVAVVLTAFKKEIASLFGRVSSLSIGSTHAEFGGESFSQQESSFAALEEQGIDSKIEKTAAKSKRPNPLASSIEITLQSRFKAELEGVSSEDAVATLIEALSRERLERIFSMAYANIFGSQIRALQVLVDKGGRASRAEANREFSLLKNEFEFFKSWDIERYLKYLADYQFIESNDDGITITAYGSEFLAFLAHHSLSRARAL
ncbi:MAG: hypothetical protein ACI9KS_001870 [Sulfitobacter sp.]|jgi:hypothetical protein